MPCLPTGGGHAGWVVGKSPSQSLLLKNKNVRNGSSGSILMTLSWHRGRCPQWLPSACPGGVTVLLPWETQGPGLCWVWMGLSSGSQALFPHKSGLCFLPVGSLQGFHSRVVTNQKLSQPFFNFSVFQPRLYGVGIMHCLGICKNSPANHPALQPVRA